jgi:hypothetical protein
MRNCFWQGVVISTGIQLQLDMRIAHSAAGQIIGAPGQLANDTCIEQTAKKKIAVTLEVTPLLFAKHYCPRSPWANGKDQDRLALLEFTLQHMLS